MHFKKGLEKFMDKEKYYLKFPWRFTSPKRVM